jgi:hypothetical protein
MKKHAPPKTNESVDYGERLVPHFIDQIVTDEPKRILGMIVKSSDISEGFRKVTFREFAAAVDFTAWWVEEQLKLKGGPNTIAYIVSRAHFNVLRMLRTKSAGSFGLSILGLASGSYKVQSSSKYICVLYIEPHLNGPDLVHSFFCSHLGIRLRAISRYSNRLTAMHSFT